MLSSEYEHLLFHGLIFLPIHATNILVNLNYSL